MDVLNENHYFINDYSLLNLLLHIAIAINRVQNGCVYTEAPSTMHPLDPQNERLAQELTERLARNFNIRFSAAEQYEMALLLVSRTSMLDYAAITPDNIADYIGSDCTDLVHQLINTVKDFYESGRARVFHPLCAAYPQSVGARAEQELLQESAGQ